MSKPPEHDDDDQIFSGPALGEDGALSTPGHSRRLAPLSPPGPPPPQLDPVFDQAAVAPVNPKFAEAPPLQLANIELGRELRPPPLDPPPPPVRANPGERLVHGFLRGWSAVRLVLVLVAVGIALWEAGQHGLPALHLPELGWLRAREAPREREQEPVPEKRVGTPAPSLLVLSEPSGAKVLVGGQEVGVTPWAGDNVWPSGPLHVEVRKAGYRPWSGTIEGGQQRTVQATLRRR